MKELSIPSEALSARQADEIFRGWIIDERLFCSIRPLIWKDDPEIWGILLSDALHHICHAIHEETGLDVEGLKKTVSQTLKAELEAPTAEHEGEFYNN